jgi:hypothetical protein
MTKTLTAEKSLGLVQSSAEAIRNDQPQNFPAAASPGDTWRQGDLYIELLAEVPAGAVPIAKPSKQLAPGETQGSRHILDSLAGVTMYRLAEPTVLDGPIVVLEKTRTLTHPEHGDVVLPPGTYGVTYQREYAEELRRVAD